jgi:hypothetical protein
MTDVVQAMISRLNARGNITRADIETLLDMLTKQKLAEFACDLRQHGMTRDEIESSMTIQTEMAREWKAQVMHEVAETFFSPPTMH